MVTLFADLLTVQGHTPSPEPKQYEKKQWDWYNQDDMVIKDGPEGNIWFRSRKESDYAWSLKKTNAYYIGYFYLLKEIINCTY